MGLQYVRLAPGFVREALEAYLRWKVERVPREIRELMMVLEIEVNRRYHQGSWPDPRERPPLLTQQHLPRVRASADNR